MVLNLHHCSSCSSFRFEYCSDLSDKTGSLSSIIKDVYCFHFVLLVLRFVITCYMLTLPILCTRPNPNMTIPVVLHNVTVSLWVRFLLNIYIPLKFYISIAISCWFPFGLLYQPSTHYIKYFFHTIIIVCAFNVNFLIYALSRSVSCCLNVIKYMIALCRLLCLFHFLYSSDVIYLNLYNNPKQSISYFLFL